MRCGAVLKRKREEAGLTQPGLARLLGVTESTLRKYELGIANIPDDVADSAAGVLKAPEIVYAKCGECPTNWLGVCSMDVDSHPNTEVIAVIQEAQEAVTAVERLRLRGGILSREQREALEYACDQVLDLVPLAAAAVASWCREYGISMREVCERHRRKLVNRGYVQEDIAA